MSKRRPLPFELGQKVTFTGTVKKVKGSGPHGHSRPHRFWTYFVAQSGEGSGFIVGYRSVVEGYTTYSEDGAQFHPSVGSAWRLWLVVTDLRRKPVMCAEWQIIPVKD